MKILGRQKQNVNKYVPTPCISSTCIKKGFFCAPDSIVSQPNTCLKLMTFQDGRFVSVLQKMKEDNISQLDHYDVPFCKQKYTHCLVRSSCSNSNLLISLIPLNCLKFWTFTQLWYYSKFLGYPV